MSKSIFDINGIKHKMNTLTYIYYFDILNILSENLFGKVKKRVMNKLVNKYL